MPGLRSMTGALRCVLSSIVQILLILLTGLFPGDLSRGARSRQSRTYHNSFNGLMRRSWPTRGNGISCFTIVQIYSAGIRASRTIPVFSFPDGKTDPQAELDATLTQFSRPTWWVVPNSRSMRFVARYTTWLKTPHAFDEARLKPLRCDRFDAWFAGFEAQAVTLIFPRPS